MKITALLITAIVFLSIFADISGRVIKVPSFGRGSRRGFGRRPHHEFEHEFEREPEHEHARARPSSGQKVRDIVLAAGVGAGMSALLSASVNAGFNRMIPGGIDGDKDDSNDVLRQYLNSTSKLKNGKNDEIKELSESLFKMDKNNAYKYITINLQNKTTANSTADDARWPLLHVRPEAYEIPTIKSVLTLYDNHELDARMKETATPERSKEEAELLDEFLDTDVFRMTMAFLINKKLIPNDTDKFKNSLKGIWFSQFKRYVDDNESSTGFEAIFLAEKIDSEMFGPRNWIYFAKQEQQGKLDYRGYIKDVKLKNLKKAEAIKVRSAFNIPNAKHSVTTLLVGLSPELEMALYTACFYIHPNKDCPISLGGKDIVLKTFKSDANYIISDYQDKEILIGGRVIM